MKKLKWFTNSYPEFYFLASVIFYWLSSSFINPFAWGLPALYILQIIWKNIKPGIIFSAIIGLLSLFMLFALLSEFKEFPAGSREGMKRLIIGGVYFITNIVMAGIMLVRYARKDIYSTDKEKGLQPTSNS